MFIFLGSNSVIYVFCGLSDGLVGRKIQATA